MMTRVLAVLPLLCIWLAACAPGAGSPSGDGSAGVSPEPPAAGAVDGMPPPVLPSPADDTCGASDLALLVGQPASAVDPARFPGPVRIVAPGQAMTMDFNPQRLNFLLDDLGEVTRIYCG